VACGNTFVCKPSEQVPFSQKLAWELIHAVGFPPGVLNLVHGGRDAVNAILDHPGIKGVSFVGSSPVAEHVYKRAAAAGKRAQALGGAKNYIIVMPDAEMDAALDAVTESAFGCAGERCLAASVVVPVGDCHAAVRAGLVERMGRIKVGNGAQAGVTMGPLISAGHKARVLANIEAGVREGAALVVDGRGVEADPGGNFVGPTLFDDVRRDMKIGSEEVFGPVLCIAPVATLDDALALAKSHPLANASSIFTTSGKSARTFRYEVDASMAGVNIGVAAPMSFFGFGGAKGSFFGDLKAHGREAFDFYTDRKVVISRW
jgi:malonate-semialdehyde dehydrogenase (acetylating)/methylmalonate-semialdehyde dehydrogenase